MENFKLIPAEVPHTDRTYAYENTILEFLDSKHKSVKIEVEERLLPKTYNGFRRNIKEKFTGKVVLHRRDNELYLEKIQ